MESQVIEGIKLAATFSWDCQRAKELKINQELSNFLKDSQDTKEIQKLLKQLGSYYGYFRLSITYALDPFDPKVVRAYWLGNDFLAKFFQQEGFTVNFPYHNLHVLAQFKPNHLNQSLAAKFLGSMIKCTIQSGLVIGIKKSDYLVETRPIKWQKNQGFYFGGKEKRNIKKGLLMKNLLGQAIAGDNIVFHFGSARLKIDAETKNQLEKYTKLTFDSLNAK